MSPGEAGYGESVTRRAETLSVPEGVFSGGGGWLKLCRDFDAWSRDGHQDAQLDAAVRVLLEQIGAKKK